MGLARDLAEGSQKVKKFESVDGFLGALNPLNQNTNFFESYEVSGDQVKFTLNKRRLLSEINYLKAAGISIIVALTEKHHQRDELSKHFEIDELIAQMKVCNPSYKFSGSQAAFLESLR